MIIAFLQLRDPPVLPALHQRHSLKLLKKDGTRSEFADDIPKLRGFGAKNKDGLAALVFQFFRFYAHEFDYDKYALSIRLGRMLTKTEKKWHIGSNNMLCIEEPFNTMRNLGNTADDTSFRGLHMELRRAFDLIAEGKFEECCEQYVFPKEEERIWQKPAAVPRPILLRSSSQQQQQGGRGGRGGFRGNRQFHRNGNAGRRSSSSVAYETNPGFAQAGIPGAPLGAQDLLWYQAQSPQLTMPRELLATSLSLAAAHESNLRFQLYTQFNQHAAIAHAQRMQSGSTTDRARTNSFDNPPLTAPIRPDLIYGFSFPMQHNPYFQPGFTTYPSSPASATAGANGQSEFRRSLHRNTAASDSGVSPGSGALRSQSQPASRTPMAASPSMAGYSTSSQSQNGLATLQSRQTNGVTIPSFIPDEAADAEFEDGPTRALSDSPPEDDGPRYIGYYVNDHSGSNRQANGFPSGGPSAHDLGQRSEGRRRLSTDQLPQSVLDRRMRRTSRSPSPMGHARAFSVGVNSAPLLSAPFPQANGKPSSKPLVVNGTVSKTSSTPGSSRAPPGAETLVADDMHHDNGLHIHHGMSPSSSWPDHQFSNSAGIAAEPAAPPAQDRPVIVNGSSTSRSSSTMPNLLDASFQQRVAMGPYHLPYPAVLSDPSGMAGLSRIHTRQLAPLDLATGDYAAHQDMPHLSPVYEHRTPSPTAIRKFEPPNGAQSPTKLGSVKEYKEYRTEFSKPVQKVTTVKPPPTGPSVRQQDPTSRSPVQEQRINGLAKENGHVRAAKNQTESFNGGWQKPKIRKKGVADLKQTVNGFSQSEQPPKNEADRKGG